MRFSRLLPTAAFIAALAPMAGLAQEEGEQRFAVEVILFRQAELGGNDSEWWPQHAPNPTTERLGVLEADAVRPLSSGELELSALSNGLASAPGYEVLGHFGWVQPAWSEQEALAVVLPLGWAPPPDSARPFAFVPAGTRLFGTLKVYRNRYLHVETDLRFHPQGLPATPVLPPVPAVDPVTGLSTAVPEESAGPPVYPMVQEQRVSSGNLYYLDHPVLGVLIEVRPLQ